MLKGLWSRLTCLKDAKDLGLWLWRMRAVLKVCVCVTPQLTHTTATTSFTNMDRFEVSVAADNALVQEM